MWALFIIDMICYALHDCSHTKQWTEQEKLTYPLVHLPLDMTSEKTSFYNNRKDYGIKIYCCPIAGWYQPSPVTGFCMH